ncbi:serine O-acetyltransferase [Niallia sp. 03190]|uniref:serine O-acetyltransferase n=1 Tax=Niallia sp. 03190 TaxID=3458061 RepID=UPI004044A000
MVRDYDPSVTSNAQVILTYSGLHAVWFYRLSHLLWTRNHHLAAQLISQLARVLTGVEIHPAVTIGKRLLIDHGTGIIIGETAEIGDDVIIYQGVTLGGVSNNPGRRHPKIGDRVFIGAGAAVLGAITIGEGAKIGALALVLKDVPAQHTAVGNPARIISPK